LCNKNLKVEVGKIATNTASSVMIEIDETVLLIAVVYTENNDSDFLPLKVEYFERFYASGRIPCNYFKREGKPSEREVLIARLVDRSIRCMFPKNLNYEIQITITVMSINPEINPDILAINGTSIALALSGLPFEPTAAIKIGYDKNIILNPTPNELKNTTIELVLSGTKDKISMIEGNFKEIDKSILLECIKNAYKEFEVIVDSINNLKSEYKCNNIKYTNKTNHMLTLIENEYTDSLSKLYKDCKYGDEKIVKFKNDVITKLCKDTCETSNRKDITIFLNLLERKILKEKILKEKVRLDGRLSHNIRKITLNANFLKRLHGSSLFTRGETQSIVSITLGTHKDAQLIDCVFFSHYKSNFILHYNFPPYAVNEIGSINNVKRREVGHGHLAKKALLSVIPSYDEFPYVIRVVSEITQSNGSSSMATVCGSSLALMDAGVPIKTHVAGIAMGLIKNETDYLILSDISGEEDFIGDIDFKITGTRNGLTALQMDSKIYGLEYDIIDETITQAIVGINTILNLMESEINEPRKSLIKDVPKVKIIKIDKIKIKDIIGKNGSIIKNLTDKYKCEINVNNDGVIRISTNSASNIELIINEIKNLTQEIKVGTNFKGRVIKLTQFGAFINLFHKKDGLLHISKINKYKLDNPNWEIEEDSNISVVVSKIDSDGKISLNLM